MKWFLWLVLVSICIKSLKMLSFCESFAKNGYRISYGFRRITDRSATSKSYLFINQSYWQLIYTDAEDDFNKNVKLLDNEGKESNWFGNQFFTAFCVWTKENRCKKEKNSIKWGDLDENPDELTLKGDPIVKSITIGHKNVILAFTTSWGQMADPMGGSVFVFFQQKPKIEYEMLMARKEDLFIENGKHASADPMALIHLVPGLDVIAVLAQYSVKDYNKRGGESNWGHGMIVLFQFDKSIKYCYTYTREISSSCTGNPKILIDCSKTIITTTDPQIYPPTEEPNNIFGVMTVISIVIVFTVILTIVWYYRRFHANKE